VKHTPLKRACLPIPAHSLILSFCIEIVSSQSTSVIIPP